MGPKEGFQWDIGFMLAFCVFIVVELDKVIGRQLKAMGSDTCDDQKYDFMPTPLKINADVPLPKGVSYLK